MSLHVIAVCCANSELWWTLYGTLGLLLMWPPRCDLGRREIRSELRELRELGPFYVAWTKIEMWRMTPLFDRRNKPRKLVKCVHCCVLQIVFILDVSVSPLCFNVFHLSLEVLSHPNILGACSAFLETRIPAGSGCLSDKCCTFDSLPEPCEVTVINLFECFERQCPG